MTPGSAFAERRWTSRDGLSLVARDYCAAGGPARLPVICLHGLTRNSRDFEDVAPAIAALGRRVVVPDVRGRGQSDRDPNPANYTPSVYANDVLRLMDALGIARAVFVGTSMGGIITMMIAGKRRRAVAASVLNDIGPEIAPEGVARIMGYVGGARDIASWEEATDYIRSINATAFPGQDEDQWRRFARRTFTDRHGHVELDYDPAISKPMMEGRYKAPKWLSWLLFRRLARRRPTLLVRGELSDLCTSDIADRMRRQAPRMERCDVPGVGHAPMLSEPAAMQAIEQFLARVE